MKTILLSFCLFGSMTSFAQKCARYLYFQEGKTIRLTTYKKNGDQTGLVTYNVKQVSDSAGYTVGVINTEIADKKGKTVGSATSRIMCNGGAIMMDMHMMIPQQEPQQNSMDVQASGSYLQYPGSIQVGDTLPDGSITLQFAGSGISRTLTVDVFNRKVEAKESVTTPAGTWDCYRISFSAKTTMRVGSIGIPVKSETTEWFAPEVGIIKTESKGGMTEITAID